MVGGSYQVVVGGRYQVVVVGRYQAQVAGINLSLFLSVR